MSYREADHPRQRNGEYRNKGGGRIPQAGGGGIDAMFTRDARLLRGIMVSGTSSDFDPTVTCRDPVSGGTMTVRSFDGAGAGAIGIIHEDTPYKNGMFRSSSTTRMDGSQFHDGKTDHWMTQPVENALMDNQWFAERYGAVKKADLDDLCEKADAIDGSHRADTDRYGNNTYIRNTRDEGEVLNFDDRERKGMKANALVVSSTLHGMRDAGVRDVSVYSGAVNSGMITVMGRNRDGDNMFAIIRDTNSDDGPEPLVYRSRNTNESLMSRPTHRVSDSKSVMHTLEGKGHKGRSSLTSREVGMMCRMNPLLRRTGRWYQNHDGSTVGVDGVFQLDYTSERGVTGTLSDRNVRLTNLRNGETKDYRYANDALADAASLY
jgi:hypothetical protein